MKSPYLGQNSPAELIAVGAGSSGYFDIPTHTTSQISTLSPDAVPRWDSQWDRGGLFGPSGSMRDFVEVIDLQIPRVDLDPSWRDFARSQPGLRSSPRQRTGFLRDITNTPAFVLTRSPLSQDSPVFSPSLPVLAPDAPASSKHLATRRAQKKLVRVRCLAGSQTVWLGLYFAFNLCLTLYNKGVLVRFPFPYTLTAVHALFGSVGGYLLRQRGTYVPAPLDTKSYAVLVAFSVLYAVNITVSNLSLQLVTIPFHQVLRAATPIFTTILSTTLLGTRFSSAKITTLLSVMAGVTLATYGDYYFTTLGFFLTLLGTFLAALKTIYTNILQSSSVASSKAAQRLPTNPVVTSLLVPPPLNLHPLDLLTRMSPLAFIQCAVYAYLSGELSRMHTSVSESGTSWAGCGYLLLLLGNGCIAFGLNVVSFTANGKVGALNMTVAANVKQVLTILLAVAIFDLTITRANALGILITIVGGASYAWVGHKESAARTVGKFDSVSTR